MSLDSERKRILQLVNEKKITPEEGATLLETIRQSETPAERPAPGNAAEPRFFRISVSNSRNGRPKVNIRLPIELVNVGLKFGSKFSPDGSEESYQQLLKKVTDLSETGKLVDILDDVEEERVEIYLE